MSHSILARRRGSRPAALLSVAAIAATVLVSTAGGAGAAVTRGAGVTADGIPTFFQDSQGIALAPCDVAASCGGAFDPTDATYFSSDAQVGPIRAVHSLTAGVAPGEGLSVNQLSRFTGSGLAPGRYTIKDPWGTISSCTADAGGKMDCRIEARRITTFLHGTRGGAGFIGNGVGSSTFQGSPTGFNQILVTGPGGFRASTSRSVLTGKKLPNTAMSSVATDGALKLGSVTKARPSTATIPVSSFGSAPLRVTTRLSGANPGAFTVTNGCASVASGSSCTIGVRYAPRANRNVSAVLTIDDNGLAAPRRVTLTGVANDTRAPKVASADPARGAANVQAGKSIKVTFTEAVREAKGGLSLVDASGDKVAAKVSRVRQSNTYLLNPGRALARGARYTVKVNGGRQTLRDLADNPARDTQWSFRTR